MKSFYYTAHLMRTPALVLLGILFAELCEQNLLNALTALMICGLTILIFCSYQYQFGYKSSKNIVLKD